jgi:Family of unknown function (DUF5906)
MNHFRHYFEKAPDLAKYIISIGKPGVTISPNSTVDPSQAAKTPIVYDARAGHWKGFRRWQKHYSTKKHLVAFSHWDANLGVRTDKYNVGDIDVSSPSMADGIEQAMKEICGPAPVKYRDGSARRSLMYKLKDGEQPIYKWSLKWRDDDGNVEAFEWLGKGQQTVCQGTHSSGATIKWRDGHPCDGLTEITVAQVDTLRLRIIELLEMYGYELEQSREGTSNADAKKLDDGDIAPSPQPVLEALGRLKNTDENFPTHDDFVLALRAIKTALGKDREHYYGDVEQWALEYPGITSEYIRGRWDSFDDSTVGWSWITARFGSDPQRDFDDGDKDPNARIPETPFEKMVARYVWVESLGRYYDMETGQLTAGREFNAANVAVATFGCSGNRTAEAKFQNAPNARKVATITLRPGEPPITTEANEYGVPVSAVNLWRPSNVKANKQATDRDVEPWLDLVRKLFGKEDTPECKYFLDYCAYLLQHPGRKIGHALVIVGGQGVGKDSVLTPLFEAVGQHNVAPVDTATLANQWTHFLKAQIVYVQEIHLHGRRDQYNHLKPFISSQKTRLQVNEKGLRQYFIPNHQNWIITSNHDDAIALDDDDRRFCVLRALINEPPADDYFAKFWAWLEAGGTENVFGWLLRRDVTGFNPMARPPMTAAKRAMLEETQPAPVRSLRSLLVDDGPFANRAVMIVNDLLSAADDWSGAIAKHAVAALKAEGFKPAHRVRLGRDVRQLWARNLPGTLSPEKMRELYLAEVAEEGKGKEAA